MDSPEVSKYSSTERRSSPSTKTKPRETSPIFNLFSDCTQLNDRLLSLSGSINDIWQNSSALFDIQASKLQTWGSDAGASSWTLDHALRNASGLQQQVLLLLGGLKVELQTVIDLSHQYSISHRDLPTSEQQILTDNIHERDGRTTPECEQTTISDTDGLQVLLDHVTETLTCLVALLPALRDPTPQNTFKNDAMSQSELRDMDLAKFMFPKAPPNLIKRLGYASWKRRRLQRDLSNVKVQNVPPLTGPVKSIPNLTQVPKENIIAVNRTSSPQMNVTNSYQPIHRDKHQGSVLSGGSTNTDAVSDQDTIFSASNHFAANSANSTVLSEPTRVKWHVVPDPPMDLRLKGEFICPYCLHKMILGDDIACTEDWECHVFRDLEPYMCTFDDCIRADKTFGDRDEWFCHELDDHRIAKIWLCHTCSEEFGNGASLERHLKEVHKSTLESKELSLIVSFCQRRSQAPLLDQPCVICRFICTDLETLKNHLAIHFEQLSLASIVEDPEGKSPVALESRGKISDPTNKKEPLETFLLELREKAFAKNEESGEGNEFASDSGSSVLENTPDITSLVREHQDSSHTQSIPLSPLAETRPLYEESRLKVERFLEEQSKVFQGDPTTELASLRSYSLQSESVFETPGSMGGFRSIRTMPPPRNQSFVGREYDLERIHQELSNPGRICVLSGIGGIGKSAITVEYSYQYEVDFAYIFWVQAETPASCANGFSRITTHLGLHGEEVIRDQERLTTLAREHLETTGKRWLLVFDNVDEFSTLQKFLPSDLQNTQGSIVITTRDSNLVPSSFSHSQIELGVLAMEDCRRILLTSTGENPKDMRTHPEYQLAADIATYAERLPLALSHIAGYIQQSSCSLGDFVELWQERLQSTNLQIIKTGTGMSHTEKTLEIVWNIGLREVTIDARELLNILAFLDSDSIHKDLLVDEHTEPFLEFLHSAEKFRYKRMTSELARRRLIAIKVEDDQETLSIHRELQLKILKDLERDPQNREKVFHQAYSLVRKKFPTTSPIQVPLPQNWPIYIKYVTHVLSLRRVFADSTITLAPTVGFARLLFDGGMSLWEQAKNNDSLELLKSAELVLGQLDSDNDLLKANIDIIVAILIQKHGFTQIPESLVRIKRALHTRIVYQETTPAENYTKNDEILLYNARSDYGYALLQYNNFKEAEPIFTECLAKYQEWGSEEEIPYEYSKYYHCMAWCNMYRYKFATSLKFAEMCVKYVTLATGAKSPSTNDCKFDQACMLLQSGDTGQALLVHTEVLETRIRLHGTSYYQTAQSFYAVGALHAMLGDLPSAESYMREALSSGHLHPKVALARLQFHLSEILRRLNKNEDEALELEAQARSVMNSVLPLNPLEGVPKKHELALFDHLLPLFGGARFTGRLLLHYVSRNGSHD